MKSHWKTGFVFLFLAIGLWAYFAGGQEIPDNPDVLYEVAAQQARKADYDEAIRLYLEAARVWSGDGKWESACLALLKASETARVKGDFGQAAENLSSAEEYFTRIPFPSREIRAEFSHLRSNIYSDQGKYREAIKEMKKAVGLKQQMEHPSDSSLALSLNNIGYNYYFLNRPDSALFYYRQAVARTGVLNEVNGKDLAMFLQNIGIIFAQKGDLDSALHYISASADIRENILAEDDPDLAYTYTNLGRLYRMLGDDPRAFDYNTRAEAVYIKHYGTTYPGLGTLYLNTGNILRVMGDYSRAVDYYRKSLHIYHTGDNPNHPNVPRLHNNLGAVYLLINQDSLAEHYLSLSLESGQNAILTLITYRNLARIQERKGDFAAGLDYMAKAFATADQELPPDHYERANLYHDYALLFRAMEQEDKALLFIEKALELYYRIYGPHHPDIAEALVSKAGILLRQGEFEQALGLFQESLMVLVPGFNEPNPSANPKWNTGMVSIELLDPFIGKADAWWGMYEQSKDSSLLRSSLDMLVEASRLVDAIRNQITDNSKQRLTQTQRNLYEKGIRNAIRLHELSGKTDVLEIAFQLMEKSKYAVLLSSLRDVEARTFAGIPDSLREREGMLRDRINTLVKQINEESLSGSPDQEKLARWENMIFDLKRDQEKLVAQFEQDYPRYFQLKYDLRVLALEALQQSLNPSTAIVEYFVGDSSLYALYISRDTVKAYSQQYDSSFIQNVTQIRASVEPMALSRLNREVFFEQQRAAYDLYQLLLKPGEAILQERDLWIIPDDILGYVSFDLLLTSPPEEGMMNYAGLDYLIRRHQVSYAYLATLSFGEGVKSSRAGKTVLGFAPTYSNLDAIPESSLISLRGMEQYLLPIRYAGEEMDLLSDRVGARVFRDEQASEANFKRFAPEGDIIHLAMHTVIDDENPMFSKLAFTLGQEGEEDGLLNTYEIYGMDFNARLVVLSACNTGSGALQRGEGIISLARAFMYAGVPGIVMTLWAVEDKSGFEIMEGFYANLSDGMSRAAALRKAKLDYLAQADQLRSHPYFWAAYVSVGDDSPLYSKKKPPAIWIAGGLVVIVLTYLIYRARRRDGGSVF